MKVIHCFVFCCIFVIIFHANVQCKSNSADNHVKEFYQWYIPNLINIYINNDLTEYVDVCVLSALRIMYLREFFQADYFTKAQDFWDEWLDVLVVHKEMKINDTTSVVPISFKFSEDKQHHLIVFVRKEKDGWRIIKVTGTEYFYE